MKKGSALWIVVAAVVVVAVIVGIFAFGNHSNVSGNTISNIPYASASGQNAPAQGSAPAGVPPAPQSEAGQLFSSSGLSQYAYQVFPGPLSAAAQAAITGFKVNEQNNSDGSVVVNFLPTNPHFKSLTYTVSSGDTVYFIEKNPAEDNTATDYDALYLDDQAVVVNSSGYIVQGPSQA